MIKKNPRAGIFLLAPRLEIRAAKAVHDVVLVVERGLAVRA